jgi:hypothetical protein
MSDRVFEDSRQWRVSHGRIDAEVYVCDRPNEGKVMISVEDNGGEGCNYFIVTPEEATLLKEFLIRKGY